MLCMCVGGGGFALKHTTHCLVLHSGLMDKHTLTSDSLPLNTSRYAAAVFKDGKDKMSIKHN